MTRKPVLPKGLVEEIYGGIIETQLKSSMLGLPPAAVDPNYRRRTSETIRTVGELKQYLLDNDIPNDAEFGDTGYECDGSYWFSWRENNE